MIVNRIKSMLRLDRDTEPSEAGDPPAETQSQDEQRDLLKSAAEWPVRYPKIFIGLSLVTGAAIGWVIKRR